MKFNPQIRSAVVILGLIPGVFSCGQSRQQSAAASQKPSAGAPPATARGNYYRMKQVKLMDQHGFERPLPAMSLLLPTDWQFQGEVRYGQGACTLVQSTFEATSPDGRMAIEMFPTTNWQWSDDPGMRQGMLASSRQMAQFGQKACEIMPPMPAGEFLKRYVVPKVRPNAKLIAVEPIPDPDVNQQVQDQARQAEAMAARAGLRSRVRGDVAWAHLQYSVNGQAVEEWVTAVTVANGTLGPSYNMATGQMGQTYFYNCSAGPMFGLRAAQGQLQSSYKFFKLVLSTLRVDPDWQARVNQVSLNIQAAQIKGARDRSAIITKSNQEISKIITEGYEARQKTMDRTAAQYSQAIRGVETYRNPTTGETIELSNQYGHAWVNNRGEYLLSDQAGFDPNVALKEEWKPLQHVKP